MWARWTTRTPVKRRVCSERLFTRLRAWFVFVAVCTSIPSCARDPFASVRLSVPVRVRTYISDVVSKLEARPNISREEFESILKEKAVIETFMDPEGYWKQYQVFVCPDKGAWESSIKSGKRL